MKEFFFLKKEIFATTKKMLKLFIDEFNKFQETKIMKPNHLNEALTEKVIEQIWNIQGSLYGLGALFKTGHELSFNADEAFGIGQCLQTFSVELAKLEDILKNGQSKNASD